ncbi:MAG: 3-hydroxybutyryl-CoA dehydrogenase [Rhodomicrobium sp.]
MGDHDEELAIARIGIIGAGQMGGGIAQVCALAGYEVFLQDVTMERVQQALKGITARLDRLAEKQKLTSVAGAEGIQRIRTGTELQLFRGCDLVIEAAVENEQIKREIFKNLCPVLQDKALICTNTSSISVTALAAHTDRPERFMGMHFMNPVPVMRLVELIRALTTSDATYSAIKSVVAKLGKTAVTSQDYPAFIVNRVLLPMINEAIFALHEGTGDIASIDTAMKLGANMPMGPLELGDFIGLDICLSIMRVLYEGTADSKYRPCPLLVKYVEAGWLGRKSGCGFYNYKEQPPTPNSRVLRVA